MPLDDGDHCEHAEIVDGICVWCGETLYETGEPIA